MPADGVSPHVCISLGAPAVTWKRGAWLVVPKQGDSGGDERSPLCSFPKLSSRCVKPEKCTVVENNEVRAGAEVTPRLDRCTVHLQGGLLTQPVNRGWLLAGASVSPPRMPLVWTLYASLCHSLTLLHLLSQ